MKGKRRIVFLCAEGVSSSILSLNVRDEESSGLSINEAFRKKVEADVIVLTPQVGHLYGAVKKRYAGVPVIKMSFSDYMHRDFSEVRKRLEETDGRVGEG